MITVAAAFIVDTTLETPRVLLTQRKAGGSYAFCWECPGGKFESGETAADAAVREVREELDWKIKPIITRPFYTAVLYAANTPGLKDDCLVDFVPCI